MPSFRRTAFGPRFGAWSLESCEMCLGGWELGLGLRMRLGQRSDARSEASEAGGQHGLSVQSVRTDHAEDTNAYLDEEKVHGDTCPDSWCGARVDPHDSRQAQRGTADRRPLHVCAVTQPALEQHVGRTSAESRGRGRTDEPAPIGPRPIVIAKGARIEAKRESRIQVETRGSFAGVGSDATRCRNVGPGQRNAGACDCGKERDRCEREPRQELDSAWP
jgi:hypothetical protein